MKRILEAGGVVFKVDKERPLVLLVRAKKDRSAWIFPKGHIEAGETTAKAALREVAEEAGVTGVAVAPLGPLLEFDSGDEHVHVRYHLISFTADCASTQRREQLWLEPAEALARLSYPDAQDLLRRALPLLQVSSQHDTAEDARDDAFRSLLQAEYAHTADALLRNEEDGEKRVTFFMTVAGAVGAALGFVLGKNADVQAGARDPLVLFALLILAGFGFLTLKRVVTRNAASDGYKRGLNRIRRHFVPSPLDPRRRFLSFDPHSAPRRRSLAYGSLGTGGWLPTVALVNAVVLGALAAVICSSGDWYVNGAVGALAAGVAWVGMINFANREYARVTRKAGDDVVAQPATFFFASRAKRLLKREGYAVREVALPGGGPVSPFDPPQRRMYCVLEGSLCFDFPGPQSITLNRGDSLFVPEGLVTTGFSEGRGRYLVGE